MCNTILHLWIRLVQRLLYSPIFLSEFLEDIEVDCITAVMTRKSHHVTEEIASK